MKKSNLVLMTVALIILTLPMSSIAEGKTEEKSIDKISAEAVEKAIADIDQMVVRLNEINTMEIESLSKAEKKELKKEVREMRNDIKAYSKSDSQAVAESAAVAANGNGLYISGGAIIIILLLILIL